MTSKGEGKPKILLEFYWPKSARAEAMGLDSQVRKKIGKHLWEISVGQRSPDLSTIKGEDGMWRLRIGVWRVFLKRGAPSGAPGFTVTHVRRRREDTY